MAIWPFGRRAKRSRKATEDESGTVTDPLALSRGLGHGTLQPDPTSYGSGKATRRDSKRRKRNNEPPRTDTPDDTVRLTNLPPGVSSVVSARFHQPPASVDTSLSRNFAPSHYQYTATVSQSSFGEAPTLRGHRANTDSNVVRRKSSKLRRNDYAREREIKNMSSPVTALRRPNTVSPAPQWWESRRGTKNMKDVDAGYLSQLSLPPGSGRSSPFDIEPCAYKVSAFDVLTPRPLLRYAEPPRYALESRDYSRASMGKEKREIIPAEELTRVARIQDLADDMDAGALRELMERDRRRKELRRIADQEKLQRKLQKRADRQREQERRKPPPSQLGTSGDGVNRNVKPGNYQTGGSIETLEDPTSSGSWLHDPSKENLAKPADPSTSQDQNLSRPNNDSSRIRARINTSPDTNMCIGDKTSTLHTTAPGTPDIPRNFELEKRHSDNSGRINTSWTTFFRRGGSRFRRPNAERNKSPSEFSIPSRESFTKLNTQSQTATQPIPIPERSYLRPGSTIPRTESKFTEHINDFPMPPRGEPQPPDPSAVSALSNIIINNSPTVALPEQRYSRSGANSPDTHADSVLLTQSLASIDSEGSWLAGLAGGRLSHPPKYTGSSESTKERLDEYAEYEADDHLTADEAQFASSGSVRKPSSRTLGVENGIDAHFEEPTNTGLEEGTLHESVGKRALVVLPESRPSSNDAIVGEFHMNGLEACSPDTESPVDEDSEIRRATSIDLGKQHVRHISAGSAKLLDISRRASEANRLSMESNGSSPLQADHSKATQPSA
ncbi:hypothetical protein FQN50_005874 [Emmonsiellopsis sp. PD_5]|nr:hypothetical protein FQN50_005874 [Emmonsiellopsis sp. PD_5]